MATYVVRVWLPDRPGALGLVASRIGAVRGDVVALDIVERGGGRAIDELTVELPDPQLVNLMIAEMEEVHGVDVEDVRDAPRVRDQRLDTLETAALLLDQADSYGLIDTLLTHAGSDLGADWCAVIDLEDQICLGRAGDAPPNAWLAAFMHARRGVDLPDGADTSSPPDVAWATMHGACLMVVVGRERRPFRARERRQLAALCRIADHRWVDLSGVLAPVAQARL